MSPFNIDRDNPTPLYYQLQEGITAMIEQGVYVEGAPLPSEQSLVDESRLSRTTVRQAIEHLVRDGILERRRGVGTFVRRQERNKWQLEKILSFTDSVAAEGRTSSSKTLSLDVVDEDEAATPIFGSDAGRLYRLERLRFVDDVPVIISTTFIPVAVSPNLDRFDLDTRSLFDILQREYGIVLKRAEKLLQARIVTPEDAKLLNMSEGGAIQHIVATTYSQTEAPVDYSISRDRGDLSLYKVHLGYWSTEQVPAAVS